MIRTTVFDESWFNGNRGGITGVNLFHTSEKLIPTINFNEKWCLRGKVEEKKREKDNEGLNFIEIFKNRTTNFNDI